MACRAFLTDQWLETLDLGHKQVQYPCQPALAEVAGDVQGLAPSIKVARFDTQRWCQSAFRLMPILWGSIACVVR
eukprot:2963455-Amphidinium_carterae.1